MLFSDDEVSTEIFETKQPVVKAMCLHVAHDCNMNCAYCFGDKGAFEGVRCLLTPEMGKKALDFLMQNSGNRRNLEVDFFGGEPLMNFRRRKGTCRLRQRKRRKIRKEYPLYDHDKRNSPG